MMRIFQESLASMAGQSQRLGEGIQDLSSERGLSTSQIIAVVTLFLPACVILILMASLTLAGTFLGLAVTTLLFVIFSPALVPLAIVIGFAFVWLLKSGALKLPELPFLSGLFNSIRQIIRVLQQMERVAQLAQGTTGQMGQVAAGIGQTALSKAEDVAKIEEGIFKEAGQAAQSAVQELTKGPENIFKEIGHIDSTVQEIAKGPESIVKEIGHTAQSTVQEVTKGPESIFTKTSQTTQGVTQELAKGQASGNTLLSGHGILGLGSK